MGRINKEPKNIRYPYPKAVGNGYSIGKIIGRVMEMECFPKWGDYMRILDLFIVFTRRKNKIRIISSRPLNKKEKYLYEKET